jgi:catechol 2,3-dioxygenase-like lactoylglutathione lyase family enzyme
MSTTHAPQSSATARLGTFDQRVEVIVIPVSDMELSKEFYQRLGWRLDVTPPSVVQLTPPGSWCSVQFGQGLTSATPGSAMAYLVVSDIVQARDAIMEAGVPVNEIFHFGPDGAAPGLDPNRGSYLSRATFSDPDGNVWMMQEITGRLPGRVDPTTTTFSSIDDLRSAMERASIAHDQHEARTGEGDPQWPEWYARYMVAEQAGTNLPM